MKPSIQHLSMIAAALLLGCNLDLSGATANISGNANVNVNNPNVKVNNPNVNVNNPNVNIDNGPPDRFRNVTGLQIEADTDTLVWGPLGPFEEEPHDQGYSGGGEPRPFPTPFLVGSPRPMRASFARFRVLATVEGEGGPIEVGPDEGGFGLGVEGDVKVDLRPRERIISAVPETPPGPVTLRVFRGDLSASKTFQVVGAGGAAEFVAE